MSKFEGMEVEVDKPVRMPILDKNSKEPILDKDGKAAYVDLLSPDSEAAQKFRRDITTARLKMRNPRSALTADRLEEEAVGLLAALTTGWYLVAKDGLPIDVPFSRANAEELYSNRKMSWLRKDVEEFIGDYSNFS